jgi:hypothetical protein
MTGGIATPFRIATDAVRRCAGLRRETAGLRAATAAAHAVRSAGARFPSAVLGGELLAMMSAQFRELVDRPCGRNGSEYARDARREFPAPADVERIGGAWSEATREHPAPPKFESSNTARGRLAPDSAGGSPRPANGAVPANAAFPAPAAPTAWESAASQDDLSPAWPSRQLSPSRAQRAGPAGVMARKLRDYWDLEQRGAISRAAAAPAAEPNGGGRRTAAETESSAPTAQPLRFGQTTFAERLQAFVAGRGEPREHTPRAAWQESPAAAPDARIRRQASAPGGGISPAGDFAEQLADTLRSQALDHGIDLT